MQLDFKLFKLKKTLDLQLLCVYLSNTLLVNYFNICQQGQNDSLKLTEWNLEHLSSLKQAHGRTCSEDVIHNVYYTFHLNVDTPNIRGCQDTTITIDNLVNHLLGLNEKCNMIGCEDFVEEVVVHCDKNFRVLKVVTTTPNVRELLLDLA